MNSSEEKWIPETLYVDDNTEVDLVLQTEKEDMLVRRSRGTDFSQALISQTEAARECAKDEIRKFIRVPVEVETIDGKPLVFSMWASENKPIHRKKASQAEVSKEIFTCESCKRSFDSARKLQAHLKCHTKDESKEDGQNASYSCSVCNKEFDQKRKLILHFRYHKANKSIE